MEQKSRMGPKNNPIKKIRCFFTGHNYPEDNLKCTLNRDEDKLILTTVCTKCGKHM